MSESQRQESIQSLTPTLCALTGVRPPALCESAALAEVVAAAGDVLVQKCLIFAPDAIGKHLFDRYPTWAEAVRRFAPVGALLRSIMPSLTPVCFASAFTGAPPARHGVQTGEKPRPVLRCDTLFDALLRAGKRVAIVAGPDSSIGRLFLDRAMDYYPERCDSEATVRTLALLGKDQHDVIVVYHSAYDDTMHATSPFAEQALQAAQSHVETAAALAAAFNRCWAPYRRAIVFAPDHGAHTDPASGRGVHGSDLPEDMEVWHFYGVY
jgi:hypothetical protein